MPLAELRDVTKVFGGGFLHRGEHTVALDRVSLSLPSERPSITAIAGESGSGKTTLARILLGVIRPTSGHVLFEGKDLGSMSRAERWRFRRAVQPIFQDPFEVFNPFYRVDHVLTTPIRRFKLAGSKPDERRLITEALELVGLRPAETLGRFPHQLSGGQRQRIMIARALLLHPKIILADEPVSMVDASLRATILASLRTLNRELGISIVYITHDLTTAYQISENIVVMYRGSVAEAGSVEEVIRSPKHPYTQLLVASIPLPDPTRRWGGEPLPEEDAGVPADACKFAPRCPHAMEICWQRPPPLYHTERHRAAACYLYRESPVLAGEDVADIFEPPTEVDIPSVAP